MKKAPDEGPLEGVKQGMRHPRPVVYAMSFRVVSTSCSTTPLAAFACFSSLSEPSSSKALCAWERANWVGTTVVPMFWRMERTCTSPRRPPSPPGEAARRPAVLPLKATRLGSDSTFGRETQSIAFFRAAETEELYSGRGDQEAVRPSEVVLERLEILGPSLRLDVPVVDRHRVVTQTDEADLRAEGLGVLRRDGHQFVIERLLTERAREREDLWVWWSWRQYDARLSRAGYARSRGCGGQAFCLSRL